MPMPWLLALSAGVVGLEAILEDRVDRQDVGRNGLSFLLHVPD